MKKLTTLLFLFSNYVFAQTPTQQIATQFDKFINKPEIEWAAYINDTVRFEEVNLNKILLARLSKNEIKASLPVGSGSMEANQVSYLGQKEINKVKFRSDTVAVYDSSGNPTGFETQESFFDRIPFSLTDITEILYIEKGQLKTYIPWVATMVPIVTSTGIYLGEGDYFSTCFNFRYNYLSPKKNSIILLAGKTRKISLDSFDVRNKLKELYGRNFVQTLWPYILNNTMAVYDFKKNTRLKTDELTTDLLSETKLMIPVYDTLGNVKGYQANSSGLGPGVFTSAEIAEDWYYDQTANIVFTRIREVYLYAKKWLPAEELGIPRPILKIVLQ